MVPLDKGKKMVEKIKNSQLEVLKECGHMIIFEKAFEMREIVKNFVQKIIKNNYEKILYCKSKTIKRHSFFN